jgi:hypothetical protein
MDDAQSPELIACLTTSLPEAKELLEACAEADIPASLARDVCCGKGGCACAPKMQLLVSPNDIDRVARMIRERWDVLHEREDLPDTVATGAEGEEPACPACGTAAPLQAGACSDCGLQIDPA